MLKAPKRLQSAALALTKLGDIEIEFNADCPATDGKKIMLPSLSPNVSMKEFNAFIGHIDHEASHILYTNLDMEDKQKRMDAIAGQGSQAYTPYLVGHVWNYFEDIRIETCLMDELPGSTFYLTEGSEDILDAMVTGLSFGHNKVPVKKPSQEPKQALEDVLAFLYDTHTKEGADRLAQHPAHIIMAQNPYFPDFHDKLAPLVKVLRQRYTEKDFAWKVTKEALLRIAEVMKKIQAEKNSGTTRKPQTSNGGKNILQQIQQHGSSGQQQSGQQSGQQPTQSGQQSGGSQQPGTGQKQQPGTGNGQSKGVGTSAPATFKDSDSSKMTQSEKDLIEDFAQDYASGKHQIDADSNSSGVQTLSDKSAEIKELKMMNNTTANVQTEENLGFKDNGEFITQGASLPKDLVADARQESRKFKRTFVEQFISFRRKLRRRYQTSGVIDPTTIHNLVTKDSGQIFKVEKKCSRVNTAVMLSLDVSGSMSSCYNIVRKMAIAIDEAVRDSNVQFAVSIYDSYYQIIKTGREKLTDTMLKHICANGGTDLAKAVLTSAKYMFTLGVERRILLVVTDGHVDEEIITTDAVVTSYGVEAYYIMVDTNVATAQMRRNVSPIPKERTIACGGEFTNDFLTRFQTLLTKGRLYD